MVKIPVITSDGKIWNRDQVIVEISLAMSANDDIVLDLLAEGPCFESLNICDIINQLITGHKYQKEIKVTTSNLIQQEINNFSFDIIPQMSFVENTKNKLATVDWQKQISKTFGLFVGRSNGHRLSIASHCWKKFQDNLSLTYHYDINLDYHKDNIGLEQLIRTEQINDLSEIADFLKNCPFKHDIVEYPILMDQHCNHNQIYQNFAIEIVCETYYTGQTFFPTEKIWRPIAMGTPFIVQGPRYFLHRLRKLGFQTFDRWWEEGYAEDPADWQLLEIKRVLDFIGSQDLDTIRRWYAEMTPILEHNRKRLFELKEVDFIGLE
jgi:hypothetical protein